MPTEEITLDPGQSEQVSFEVVPVEARTYTISVNGLTGNFEAIGLIPEITDPRITLQTGISWGYDTLAQDLIAGAELSVDFRIKITRAPNLETYLFEFCLIQDSTIIPIGSSTTEMWDSFETWISFVPKFLVTLPVEAGIYDTMLRIYRNGVLAAQYPYLGITEVLPKGISNFSYTKPTIQIYWNPDWPAYLVKTSSTITNIGPAQESRKIVLWILCEYEDIDRFTRPDGTTYAYFHKWDREWKCLRDSGGEEIVILNPGQSYNYYYDNRARISGSQTGCVQLRDEDGGVSPKSDKEVAP